MQKSLNIKRDVTPQFGFYKIVMWTLLFQLGINYQALKNIIKQGFMPGSDDFMRLIQVRAFLSGQSWFDLSSYRMMPPDGVDMHWSRIVDIPLAGLIYVLSLVTGQISAERITSVIWPALFLIAVVLVITKICDSLSSGYHRALPMFFTVLCLLNLSEFTFGRIDHHSIQILLYVGMLWCTVNRETPRANILAGFIMALSISIGLDLIFFLALFIIWFGLEWIAGSDQNGASLRRFGLSLAVSAPLLYVLNIGPNQWLIPHCDANSSIYFIAQISIAASMLIMSASSRFLMFHNSGWKTGRHSSLSGSEYKKIATRLGLATILALLCLLLLFLVFPQCAGGPLGEISEELHTRWLSSIGEALGLFPILKRYPEGWIVVVAYSVFIFTVGIWLLRQGIENKKYIGLLLLFFLASVFMTIVQYRFIRIGIFGVVPICVLATGLISRKLTARYGKESPQTMVGQVSSVILLSAASWTVAGVLLLSRPEPTLSNNNVMNDIANNSVPSRKFCNYESDYELLASLPKGHVMSDLNSAPSILVFTDKTVVSGNYHRNGRGILDVLDFFETNVDKAHEIAKRRKIDYVAFCVSISTQRKDSKIKSDDLESLLLSGKQPAWLERLSGDNKGMLVFRVKN